MGYEWGQEGLKGKPWQQKEAWWQQSSPTRGETKWNTKQKEKVSLKTFSKKKSQPPWQGEQYKRQCSYGGQGGTSKDRKQDSWEKAKEGQGQEQKTGYLPQPMRYEDFAKTLKAKKRNKNKKRKRTRSEGKGDQSEEVQDKNPPRGEERGQNTSWEAKDDQN